MNWFDAKETPPPHTGIYLVYRDGNRHPTSRQYYERHGWQSGHDVLFWAYCPPPPPGHDYPHGVAWREKEGEG